MAETCLLGAAAENHIVCPGWSKSILLYRRDGRLHCKARDDLFIDDMDKGAAADGAVRADAGVDPGVLD